MRKLMNERIEGKKRDKDCLNVKEKEITWLNLCTVFWSALPRSALRIVYLLIQSIKANGWINNRQ